jgi:signal transduction histidine kinase/ActR/RegA family two-component response regulator
MIGRNLLEAYPELGARGLDQYFRDALEGQVRMLSQRLHGYFLPMTAEMQQSARIAPLVEDKQVVGTITLIDDVSERVAREQELEELLTREQAAKAEAEAANRAKDEFLAVVSHELRTPLNAIYGWIQILRSEKTDRKTFEQALDAMGRNARAQARLIEDILDVSRIITGNIRLDVRPVDLTSIVEAAIDSLQPAIDNKEIHLVSSLDPQAGPISGDPSRLQQVVWNLLSNAVKFTPRGGRIEVRLDRADSQAEISVTDTGQGISPEFLPHVFERFRQADSTSTRKHSGLGLGLSIVRHLIEMHGGKVEAHSDGEGQGATFRVMLPLMALRKERASSARDPSQGEGAPGVENGDSAGPALSLKGLRVLIVDDEPDAREMLDLMLKQHDADVKVTETARGALELMEQWKPDILVSDIGMPVEDGYSLIHQVRALKPERGGDTPAVALTGYASHADREQLLASGYQIHMAKPVEVDELVMAIARLSGRGVETPASKTDNS